MTLVLTGTSIQLTADSFQQLRPRISGNISRLRRRRREKVSGLNRGKWSGKVAS